MIPALAPIAPAVADARGASTFPPPPPPPPRALVWSIAAFFALALGWAALARIDAVVTAPARLVPERGLQKLGALDGGIVAAILVWPGDRVRAGQPLIRLDSTEADAARDRDAVERSASRARATRLAAEARGRTPAFLSGGADTSAEATERALFGARAREQAAARAAAAARVDQAARAAAAAQADLSARTAALAAAAREVATLGPLVERGIDPAASLTRARGAQAQADAQAEAARALLARDTAALAAARADAAGIQRHFRAAAAEALAATQAHLVSADRAAFTWRARAARTLLRAPAAGTVQRLLVATVGGTARPGEPLIEIVPADGTPIVEAHIAARNIVDVHVGQRASVRLSAYDYAVHGAFAARVLRVSPDAEIDEARHTAFYTVRLALISAHPHAPHGRPLLLLSGMTADVAFIGERRTVLSYLLTPFTRLRGSALSER